MKFKVEPEIFEKFPKIRIGVLVVLGMDNKVGGREIAKLLAEEEKKKQKELKDFDLKEIPKISHWREIYQKFGSKPREYRSSVEALLRRVQAGNKIPNINSLVDLYNYISIKHFVPAGAEDLDKVKGDIVLGFAKGDEDGRYIGSDEVSTCYPDEVVYKDDLGFICRRWNWQEGERTKITPETKNAVLVLEGVSAVSGKEFQAALQDAASLLKNFLKAKVKIRILDEETNEFDIVFEPGRRLSPTEIKRKEIKKVEKAAVKPEPERKLKLVDKGSLSYQLRKLIYQVVVEVVGKRRVKFEDVALEHPAQPEHGDYSTNIALKLKTRAAGRASGDARQSSKLKASGREILTSYDLANVIVNAWRSQGLPEYVGKIDVVQPGFINIWLQNEYLSSQLFEVIKKKSGFGGLTILEKKKILLEHTSPNPQTTIMLGHLRNNFLGMATANILEFLGAKVNKDCIVNDRGVHLCRAIWGYLVFGRKKSGLSKTELKNFKKITNEQIKSLIAKVKWQELLEAWVKKKSSWLIYKDLKLKPDHANLIWYVLGSRAYELSAKVLRQVQEILIAWEAEDKKTWQVWRQILDWSAKGYKETYKRVRSVHDWVWYESDHYKQGKEIVALGLKKGVFRQSEGAVITDLAKYGLPDTVVVKADGTALYITQDLALTKLKCQKFPSDLYIWCIGEEQTLYFKQLFAVCEQLGLAKAQNFFHLGYALINFKAGGKMATRKGDVVMADEILDELKARAEKLTTSQMESLAEKVAVGAVKYSLLKFSRDTTIYFDIDESLALEGDSAPYLQYSYARCLSVLHKAKHSFHLGGVMVSSLDSARDPACHPRGVINEEELALLRTIYKFPEVVLKAGEQFSPNLICNFLFDLAQKYNLFYNRHRILKAEPKELRDFRLALTTAVGQIIKNGLELLGIEAPERM